MTVQRLGKTARPRAILRVQFSDLAASRRTTQQLRMQHETLRGSWRCWWRSTNQHEQEGAMVKVTQVDITRIEAALASVVLDDQFYVSGIAVHRKLLGAGFRFTYTAHVIEERSNCLFEPIERLAKRAIEDSIAQKLTTWSGEPDA
jgi:hypothetical protein